MTTNIPALKALKAIFQEYTKKDYTKATGKIIKIIRKLT
jgi:hypothetical protein